MERSTTEWSNLYISRNGAFVVYGLVIPYPGGSFAACLVKVKYNASGNKVYSLSFGGNLFGRRTDIAFDEGNGIFYTTRFTQSQSQMDLLFSSYFAFLVMEVAWELLQFLALPMLSHSECQ
jgi:hypothetical protein